MTPEHGEHSPIKFATPLEDEDRRAAYHDNEPLRYCTVTSTIGDQPLLAPAQRDLDIQLHLTHDGEPTTNAEAQSDLA